MIEASFEQATHKSAAIGGIYQYDTGQRLRMHGLPTPEELAEMDDFLVGDAVTVQAQYGYAGDSQTETRIASFDAETGCWMADIPDVYLKRSSAVKVFVYVSYGATADETRAKTCYEGSFTPISRPAPSTQVTPSQGNAWDALVTEINLTLSKMNTAISEANAAAEGAKTQAEAAQKAGTEASTAALSANTQAQRLANMNIQAQTREYGSGADGRHRREARADAGHRARRAGRERRQGRPGRQRRPGTRRRSVPAFERDSVHYNDVR